MFRVPEKHRIMLEKEEMYYSDESFGNNGAFGFLDGHGVGYQMIVSDEEGWEHVSLTVHEEDLDLKRTPTWEEMCFVKNVFWSDDDAVVQYHPAKADYRNCHPYCLHLWRPKDGKFPTPSPIMVAP